MTYPLSTSSSDSEDLWTSQTLKTKKVTSDLTILSQHPALRFLLCLLWSKSSS